MISNFLLKIAHRIISNSNKNPPHKKKNYFDFNNSFNALDKKYKVIGITPAGRKRYLEVLIPHLLNQKSIIQNHIFWLNTTNEDDIQFIKEQCLAHPDFFSYQEPRIPVEGNKSISHFFKDCIDPDAIYIRFDDDICWIEENAVEELVKFRINNPQYFIIFGNIVNNSICNILHQRFGSLSLNIGELQNLSYTCLDPEGWGNGKTAEQVHKHFIDKLLSNRISDYFFDQWILLNYERFSVNFMAFFGSDFARFDGLVGQTEEDFMEEEPWLTEYKPKIEHRPNCVCGTALFTHFAFFPQRDYLESQTDLLRTYHNIAIKNESSL